MYPRERMEIVRAGGGGGRRGIVKAPKCGGMPEGLKWI